MEDSDNYHETHQVLKIRRSSYHNVIRLSDLAPVVDTLYLQNYVINQAKVGWGRALAFYEFFLACFSCWSRLKQMDR